MVRWNFGFSRFDPRDSSGSKAHMVAFHHGVGKLRIVRGMADTVRLPTKTFVYLMVIVGNTDGLVARLSSASSDGGSHVIAEHC